MTCTAREPFSLTSTWEENDSTQVVFFLFADLSEPLCLYCLSLLWHFYGFGPCSLNLVNSRHVMGCTVMINPDGNTPSPRDVCPISKGPENDHTAVPSMSWCWGLCFFSVFLWSLILFFVLLLYLIPWC